MSVDAVLKRLQRAIWAYGYIGAAKRAGTRLLELTHRQRADPLDVSLGVDTGGIVRLEGLSVVGDNARYGVRYQASDVSAVRSALASLAIQHEDFTFVDIGSGKGRVLLLAADYPFKRIIGVEFAEELHHIASQNVRRVFGRSTRLETVCHDATEYELPADPLVLYFYNPFMPSIMRLVMDNVARSLRQSPRPVYMILRGGDSLVAEVGRVGFRRVAGGGVGLWEFVGSDVPGA